MSDFISKESELSVEEAVAKVESASIENGFGVVNTLDLKAIMAKKGVEYGEAATVVEICQPHHAKSFLEKEPRAAPCLPCRIAITSKDGKTVVQTVRPTVMMQIFDNPEIAELAKEIDAVVEKIVGSV
ncbi:MAG: DUF302 domain-containing protein [Planctomycetes bacterium]|nr:DUF302 domain-containing protein [Planctomycetota bacterium]